MPRKPKHIPLRRCVVCRESKPQAELLRFVKTESRWLFDSSFSLQKRKTDGRGAWLCKDGACHKENALKRFFRQDAEQVFSDLKEHLNFLKKETNATPNHVESTEATSAPKRIRVAPNGGMNV